MSDPRVEAYARLLVERSIDPRPGGQVLVSTTTDARPLAEELSRQLARPAPTRCPASASAASTPSTPPGRGPPRRWPAARPRSSSTSSTTSTARSSSSRRRTALRRGLAHAEQRRAFEPNSWHTGAGAGGHDPRGALRLPVPCSPRAGRDAAGRVRRPLLRRLPPRLGRGGAADGAVRERFDRAREVRIVAPDTDLTLCSRAARGDRRRPPNVPGGEVFFSPVEDSVEGECALRLALREGRGRTARVRRRRGGRCDGGRGRRAAPPALETDPGARRFGELGLGCNEAIRGRLNNVLFDEKMGGTVHLALGQGFAHLGGTNTSDAALGSRARHAGGRSPRMRRRGRAARRPWVF